MQCLFVFWGLNSTIISPGKDLYIWCPRQCSPIMWIEICKKIRQLKLYVFIWRNHIYIEFAFLVYLLESSQSEGKVKTYFTSCLSVIRPDQAQGFMVFEWRQLGHCINVCSVCVYISIYIYIDRYIDTYTRTQKKAYLYNVFKLMVRLGHHFLHTTIGCVECLQCVCIPVFRISILPFCYVNKCKNCLLAHSYRMLCLYPSANTYYSCHAGHFFVREDWIL